MLSSVEITVPVEHQKVLREIQALTSEYAIVWEERERLVQQTKPTLLVKYNLEIGTYVLSFLNRQIEFSKLKRKIELLQASLNHNKRVHIAEIEVKLKKEFSSWIDQITNLEKEVRESQQTIFEPCATEEHKKMRDLYRNLVRQLHPDINKNLTAQQKILWNRVQVAYKNWDLNELSNLQILVESLEAIASESPMEILMKRKESLWKQIQSLYVSLNELKHSFPFDLQEKLDDPLWIESEVGQYKTKIIELEKIIPEYERQLNSVMVQLYGRMEEHPENL